MNRKSALAKQEVDEMVALAHRRMASRLNRIRRPRLRVGVTDSALGELFVALNEANRLLLIHFLDTASAAETARTVAVLKERFELVADDEAAQPIRKEIQGWIEGSRNALKTPIDLALVESSFRSRVLESLLRIPPGAVISYQALAAAVGAPKASRAVGGAMASNPLPVYVPCHRVIRSDNSIGNYGGGVNAKIRLLRAEGFTIERSARVGSDLIVGHRETKIYCRAGCRAATRADRLKMLAFATPDAARNAGYRSCKVCRPDSRE
jgi:methylated-DNA-[protein]-cysteine S-methyltransferase